MIKILLICSTGVTTSLLTNKLEAVIKDMLPGYILVPCSITEFQDSVEQKDVLLLTPQVRFNYEKITQLFPDNLVIKIDQKDYENLNALEIISFIVNEQVCDKV